MFSASSSLFLIFDWKYNLKQFHPTVPLRSEIKKSLNGTIENDERGGLVVKQRKEEGSKGSSCRYYHCLLIRVNGYNSLIKAKDLGTDEADSSIYPPSPLSTLDMTPLCEGIDKRLNQVKKDSRVSAPYIHYYPFFFYSSHSSFSPDFPFHIFVTQVSLLWIMSSVSKLPCTGQCHF